MRFFYRYLQHWIRLSQHSVILCGSQSGNYTDVNIWCYYSLLSTVLELLWCRGSTFLSNSVTSEMVLLLTSSRANWQLHAGGLQACWQIMQASWVALFLQCEEGLGFRVALVFSVKREYWFSRIAGIFWTEFSSDPWGMRSDRSPCDCSRKTTLPLCLGWAAGRKLAGLCLQRGVLLRRQIAKEGKAAAWEEVGLKGWLKLKALVQGYVFSIPSVRLAQHRVSIDASLRVGIPPLHPGFAFLHRFSSMMRNDQWKWGFGSLIDLSWVHLFGGKDGWMAAGAVQVLLEWDDINAAGWWNPWDEMKTTHLFLGDSRFVRGGILKLDDVHLYVTCYCCAKILVQSWTFFLIEKLRSDFNVEQDGKRPPSYSEDAHWQFAISERSQCQCPF